jgi:hypothetical protein
MLQVLENNNINAESRNQAISAAADGVPFFKDRNAANGWPFVLFPENAPVGVSRSNSHAHMVGLVPSEYLTEDEDGKRVLVKKYVIITTCHDFHTPHTYYCVLYA